MASVINSVQLRHNYWVFLIIFIIGFAIYSSSDVMLSPPVKSGAQNVVTGPCGFIIRLGSYPEAFSDDPSYYYNHVLKPEHDAFIADAETRIGRSFDGGDSSITGNVIAVNAQQESAASTCALPVQEYSRVFNGYFLPITKDEAVKLADSPYVAEEFENKYFYSLLYDVDPLIHATQVWGLNAQLQPCAVGTSGCLTGTGSKIAIIDSGVDYTHPDFGACARTSNINSGSCAKIKDGYDFVNKDNDPFDDYFHGTHIASIAAGKGSIKGIAPDASLYVYKVSDANGRGSSDAILSAIDRAVDPNNDHVYTDKADIVSLSMGADCTLGYDSTCGPNDYISKTFDNLAAFGVVPVVAAGNKGANANAITSPGTARDVITVGATTKQDTMADISSRGPVVDRITGEVVHKPDLVAPGWGICAARSSADPINHATCGDSIHILEGGTSMAAPVVAGTAALMKQANPTLTPTQIKARLRASATNLNYDLDTQGAGRIDVMGALQSNGGSVPPSDGLIARYTFDSVSSGVALDSSPTRNNAAVVRLYESQGALGRAMIVSGVNSVENSRGYAMFRGDALPSGKPYFGQEFTFSTWIRLDKSGQLFSPGQLRQVILDQSIFGQTWSPIQVFSYWDGSNNKFGIWMHSSNAESSRVALGSRTNLEVGKWYNVALTLKDSQLTFYVNGQLDQPSVNTNGAYPYFSKNSLYIGGANLNDGTSYDTFNGAIDDLRIYDKALTASELAQLYSQKTADGLVVNYKLDSSSSTGTTPDSSPYAFTGTMPQTPTVVNEGAHHGFKFGLLPGNKAFYVDTNVPIYLGKEFSFAGWIKLDKSGKLVPQQQRQVIFDQSLLGRYWSPIQIFTYWDGYNDKFGIWMNPTNSESQRVALGSSTNLQVGTWYHVALTLKDNKLTFYVNGQQDQAPYSVNGAVPYFNGQPILIGAATGWSLQRTTSAYDPFNGAIDDVRIYDRGLNAQEIQQLYVSS